MPRNNASNYAENQNSIALLIQYNSFDLFIAGDLTDNVEQTMVDEGDVPNVDVYHVSHHGSNTSSSEEFVRELSPEVAIVSNGTKFKHPTEEVLGMLLENDIEVYQTNKNVKTKNVATKYIGDIDPVKDKGTILIEVGNDNYVISLERNHFNKVKRYPIEITP